MTRVAVAGATGQVGQLVVAALRDAGHEPAGLSRARGVDVLAGGRLLHPDCGQPAGRRAAVRGPAPRAAVHRQRRRGTRQPAQLRRDGGRVVRASWRDSPFGLSMAGEVLLPGAGARIGGTSFTDWLAHDFGRLRTLLADEATFQGPLGRAGSGDECVTGLQGMTKIMTGLEITRMVVDGPDVMTWYDLLTGTAPPTPTVNWMHVEDGKIAQIRATFDPRAILGIG